MKFDVHDLDDRPQAGHGGAHGQAHEALLGNGCADAASGPEALDDTGGELVHATGDIDVFANDENAVIPGHLLDLGLDNGICVGEFSHFDHCSGPSGSTLGNGLFLAKSIASSSSVSTSQRIAPIDSRVSVFFRNRLDSNRAMGSLLSLFQAGDFLLVPAVLDDAAVRFHAIGFAFEEGSALTGVGAGDRFGGLGVHVEHVVAVGDGPRQAEGCPRAGAMSSVQVLLSIGVGRGIAVVLADVDQRQPPQLGHVQAFIQHALVGGAFA